MAFEKKKENTALKQLKADLKTGELAKLYLFYGEESYLKEHYRDQISQKLCPADTQDFTLVRLGDGMSRDDLMDAVESFPFGADRKVVLVSDYPLLKPTGDLKEALPGILSDLPDHVCLIFYFDALEFKPDKRLTLWKVIEKHGTPVEFAKSGQADLIPWIKRRFAAHDKLIDTPECEYLIFLCGSLMTNLITEVDKISAYAARKEITRADIDAVASRVLDADVFAMTEKIVGGDYPGALAILQDLFASKNQPVVVQGAITKQMQRLYGAKLAFEARKGEEYLAKLFGFRSSYPARLLLQGARKVSLKGARKAVQLCAQADLDIKSNIPDPERVVELLLLQLAAEVRA